MIWPGKAEMWNARRIGGAIVKRASAQAGFGGLAGPHDFFKVDRLAEDGLGPEPGGAGQSDRIARPGAEDDPRGPVVANDLSQHRLAGAVVQRQLQEDTSGRRVETGSRLGDGRGQGDRPSPAGELSPQPLTVRGVPIDDQDALVSHPHDPPVSGRADHRVRLPSPSPRSHPRSRYRPDRSSWQVKSG